MAYSISWNEASPAGASTNASTLDTELQDLKKSVRERINDLLDSSTAWETDAQDPKLLDPNAFAAGALNSGLTLAISQLTGTPSLARVYFSSNITISTGVPNILNFNLESLDTASYHSNVTNNSRLTCAAAGYYRVSANIWITAGAAANHRSIYILQNGSSIARAGHDMASGGDDTLQIEMLVLAAATDYFEIDIQHSAGVSDTAVNGATLSYFQIEKLNGTT